MSIFKGIKDKFWETGFLDELGQHFGSIGIEAAPLAHDSPDAVHHTPALGIFGEVPIGSLKLESQNVDFVELYRAFVGGTQGIGHVLYRYWYIVKTAVGDQNAFKAMVEPVRKGIINKTAVGLDWKGGRLARLLAGDANLTRMIMEVGFPDIGVRAFQKDGYVASGAGNRWSTITVGGFPIKYQLVVGKGFPSREAFDVFNRIAGHVRSMSGGGAAIPASGESPS